MGTPSNLDYADPEAGTYIEQSASESNFYIIELKNDMKLKGVGEKKSQ